MRAASFIMVVEIFENLAFLANASNLVLYLSKYMHLSPTKSANNVTNFMATAFLLALLGGFSSDTFFISYYIYLMSAGIEFLGLLILTFQARSPYLKPPPCPPSTTAPCPEVHGGKAAMLFIGLYLAAFGVGGIKGSLPSLGAEQFNENTSKGRKQRSTFFNYFVFCLSCGGLIAVTFVLWVEDNIGWQWGFGISTISILLSIIVFVSGSCFYRCKVPQGSPLTTMFKVLVAATLNISKTEPKQTRTITHPTQSPHPLIPTYVEEQSKTNEPNPPNPSKTLKWLNRAVEHEPAYPWLACSVQEVENVKIILQILPIFGCTIILNCCLAQLSTFSVHQAATMNTSLGSFRVPPASLPVFPILFMMVLAPLYDHIIIPYARKWRKTETGVTHLERIGVGLGLSVLAMAIAPLVEIKRKKVANGLPTSISTEPLPVSFLWLGFQYLFLGSADLFVLAGLMEFSFTEAPAKMRSLATSFSWASLAMGYYLSGVIVAVVNGVSGAVNRRQRWLSGENLNHYHLDRFYWLLCVLSVLNFVNYLYWANRYKYRSTLGNI